MHRRSLVEGTRYKRWANERLFAHLSELPLALLDEAHEPFGSVLRVVHHVALMDMVWRCHLEGRPHGLTSRAPREDLRLEDIRCRQRELDDWFEAFADHLESERDEPIAFDFIGGGRGRMRPSQIIVHVVNHGTYHRGHISAMLYPAGAQPPPTDLPIYVRQTVDQ